MNISTTGISRSILFSNFFVRNEIKEKNRSTRIYNENRAAHARCICSRAFSHDDHRPMLFRRAHAYEKKRAKKFARAMQRKRIGHIEKDGEKMQGNEVKRAGIQHECE